MNIIEALETAAEVRRRRSLQTASNQAQLKTNPDTFKMIAGLDPKRSAIKPAGTVARKSFDTINQH